jgi:EmrB/QacA subfamily drug resistance transporter
MSIDAAAYDRRWRTLGALALSLVIVGLDNTILNVALPTLQESLDASASKLQWMVDSYLLVFGASLLTAGTLADRIGRRRMLQAGVLVFGLASLAAGLAPSADALIGWRAVMGLGAAMIMPATLSTITAVFPREERAKAIGIWAGLAALGIGLGPLVGGLLLEWFDWGSVFYVNVPVAALALLAGVWLVPETRDPRPGRFDLVGAGLSSATLVALIYAIIEAPSSGWLDPVVLGCFALAAVLLAAFLAWERWVAEPMLDLGLLREPRFSVSSLAVAASGFGLMGGMFVLTLFLQVTKGYTALEAGAVMTPIAVGLVIGAGRSAALAARIGSARVIALGLVVMALCLAATFAWSPGTAAWAIALVFFFVAVGMGLVNAPGTDLTMGSVPEERSGVAAGVNNISRQVGGALGVAIVGSIATSVYAARLEDPAALPPAAGAAADDSVAAAHGVAAGLPGGLGRALVAAADHAYTDALAVGSAVAAGVAVLTAWLALRRLPAHADAGQAAGRPALREGEAR